MWQWRVSKYDPQLRDRKGSFLGDTWTAASDVGRVFGGQVLTTEAYLAVEDLYVEAALSFLRETGLSELTVVEFESPDNDWIHRDPLHGLGIDQGFSIAGKRVSETQIADVCRLTLRETIWCKLEESGQFFLHFGYDFYMYVGSIQPCEKSIEGARLHGLFVEPMPSPHSHGW